MTSLAAATGVRVGSIAASAVYQGPTLVWPVVLPSPSRPTGTNASHTGGTLTWAAVPNATMYDVRHQNATVATGISALTMNVTGLANNATFDFQVRARNANTNATSPWSLVRRLTTGRPEVRNSGTHQELAQPAASGTWRSSDGWAFNGNRLAQGFYSASNNNGFAIASYDGPAWRARITSQFGAAVLANLTVTRSQVFTSRIAGAGAGAALPTFWWVTDAWAHSGGLPVLQGNNQGTSISGGQAFWIEIPAHWGRHVVFNENVAGYTIRSLALHNATSANYMLVNGLGMATNAMALAVDVSWNFVTQTFVAPAWSAP